MVFESCHGRIITEYLKKGNRAHLCGTVERKETSLQACSVACLRQDICLGFLFGKDKEITQRCKMITPESDLSNPQDLSGYEQYYPRTVCSYSNCNFVAPVTWVSGCPTVYFPLNSALEGTAYGNNPGAIDFTQPGKVGNGLSFINPSGSLRASFNLHETFTSPDYCVMTPDSCQHGWTISFWLNFLGHHSVTSVKSVLCTKTSPTGHGLAIYWRDGTGFKIDILRSDGIEEQLVMTASDYPSGNRLGIWYHYIISYKSDGNNPSDIFDLYLDGTVVSILSKSVTSKTLSHANSGVLTLAKAANTDPNGDDTWIRLDEILIWERLLACGDAMLLYQGY